MLLYFVNSYPVEYNGVKSAEHIVQWARQKTQQTPHIIKSKTEMPHYSTANKVLVILSCSANMKEE